MRSSLGGWITCTVLLLFFLPPRVPGQSEIGSRSYPGSGAGPPLLLPQGEGLPYPEGGQDPLGRLLAAQEEKGRKLARYGTEKALVAIHGYLDMTYIEKQPGESGFDLYHANLFFSGYLSERFMAYVEVEYEHASETIELDQTEIRYFPFEDRDLMIAGGRFYAPFGLERWNTYPTHNELVSRPAAFRNIIPGNWYETGIRADYRHPLEGLLSGDLVLDVEASLSNGLGSSANTDIRAARQFRDNNHDRAVIGRVGIEYQENLKLGASGATQKYNRTDRISFLGFDLEYRLDPLLIRTEYLKSFLDDPGGPVGDFDREGFYVQATFRLWEEKGSFLDLSGRFDWIDPNNKVNDNNDLDTFALAVRYSPEENFYLKLEYIEPRARYGIASGADRGATLQVVLSF